MFLEMGSDELVNLAGFGDFNFRVINAISDVIGLVHKVDKLILGN